MAIRSILKGNELFLRKKSRPVTDFNERLWTILDDMGETVTRADGAGLAAPQIGILRRYFVMNFDDEIIEAINPEIVETKGEQDGIEGCLSFPGTYGMVKRPAYAKMRAFNRNGKEIFVEGEGVKARCICHEIDHLDGIVFENRAYKILTSEELEDYIEKRNREKED